MQKIKKKFAKEGKLKTYFNKSLAIALFAILCQAASLMAAETVFTKPKYIVPCGNNIYRSFGANEATVFNSNSIQTNYFKLQDQDGAMLSTGAIAELRFANSSSSVRIIPENLSKSKFSRIDASGEEQLPSYTGLRYSGIYPSVDLLASYDQGRLRYSFVLTAGADPRQISIEFGGARSVATNADGSLVADYGNVALEHRGLRAYQEINGKELPVRCAFAIGNGKSVSFALGDYDKNYPLVIDPVVYASYIGGVADDKVVSMKRLPDGNILAIGSTMSAGFGTTLGAYSRVLAGETDIFVSKINPSTGQLVFSTLVGGSSTDLPRAMEVDVSGNIYICGYTSSTNFPVTAGAYQTASSGNFDVFVLKMNSNGSSLLASTLLGSTATDIATCIAIGSDGSVVVGGQTSSANFPTTAGAYDRSFNGMGDDDDAFLTKLNSNLSQLVYSTFLGSSSREKINCLALDSDGKPVVSGFTYSALFPVTAGAFQSTFGGGLSDVFVTKFNSNASSLEFSTLLGGGMSEEASAIVLDASNNIYITGYTWSTNYPVSANAFRGSSNGSCDAFLTKLSPDGTTLLASSYFGGSGVDRGLSIALDARGNIVCGGLTQSTDLPTDASSFYPAAFGDNDVFIARLNPSASQLIYSTYFGSTGSDVLSFMESDTTNIVYFGGYTDSGSLPASSGALQLYAGGGDGFVGMFRFNTLMIDFMSDSAIAGRSFPIQFTAEGGFAQENQFQILLSDADGSFASPTVLATVVGGDGVYSLDVLLPDTVQFSTKYKVMVRANMPLVTKSDNIKGLTILHRFSLVANSITPTEFGSIELGDYNNDGLLDILITGQTANGPITELYRTNPDMTFTKLNVPFVGVSYGTAIWGDADNDGLLDIFVAGSTGNGEVARLYKNMGNDTFEPVFEFSPARKCSAAFGDYDNDGLIDLVYNGTAGTPGQNLIRLYRNNGDMTFTAVNAGLPSSTAGTISFCDYNSDGLRDIFVNGMNSVVRYSRLYKNNGNGTFTNQSSAGIAGCYNSSAAWFDADGDGDEDLLLSGYDNFSRWTRLYRNASGTFADAGLSIPQVSSGALRAIDFNSDGRRDMLVTGSDGANTIALVYAGNPDGSFAILDDSELAPLANGAWATGDLNADGKPEIISTGFINAETKTIIYRNNDTNKVVLPAAPDGLAFAKGNSGLVLKWNRTAATGSTYSVRVGTTPGGRDILNSYISPNGRNQLGTMGNMRMADSLVLKNIGMGVYYWSVTAISAAGIAGPESEEMQIALVDTQLVALEVGWNEISLFVNVDTLNIYRFFAEHPAVAMVYEGRTLKYERGNSVDDQSVWDPNSGYIVYSDAPCQLAFVGNKFDLWPRVFPVRAGWNLLPQFASYPKLCSEVVFNAKVPFAIKDAEGHVYCPFLGLNGLQVLTPGKAYWYWFDSAGTFSVE